MAAERDAKAQSDIARADNYHNPDGSFRRAPSSFRDFIQKGGKFEAEKGTLTTPRQPFNIANGLAQTAIISISHMLAVSPLAGDAKY